MMLTRRNPQGVRVIGRKRNSAAVLSTLTVQVNSQDYPLRVGDRVLENVIGSVASTKGSLLLGQSFLGRFKSWSIDNGRHALLLE